MKQKKYTTENKAKSWLLKNINKINTPLAKLKEQEGTNNNRNEIINKKQMTTYDSGTKKIITNFMLIKHLNI